VIDFDKKPLRINDILNKVNEKDIYEFYLKESVNIDKPIRCCFHDDKTPSLRFYKNKYGELNHKCFGCGKQGSVFNFVKDLYNLNLPKAIDLISNDFKIDNNNIQAIRSKINIVEREILKTQIIPTYQSFTKIDYKYWNEFYIPLDLLYNYGGRSCKYIDIITKRGEHIRWGEYYNINPIYSYELDGHYKIYRPLNYSKSGKWVSNTDSFDIQGLKQLPSKGELLIITKSMKDVLVLKVLGYNAIAPGGEGMRIPDKIIYYLYSCFDNIIVFYDNDKEGLKYGNKLATELNTSNIIIPLEYNQKDISDFTKFYTLEESKKLMNKLI